MVKLRSAYKDYLWGGTKIRDVLKKDVGGYDCVAESWEISTHPAGKSVIAEGEYAGKTLDEYFSAVGWSCLGAYGESNRRLPVLVKYIDASAPLSIQVHPDDRYAHSHTDDDGKCEIWFILGAEKGAHIYLGFNRDVSEEEVRGRIREGTLTEILNKIPVKKGEAYYIPAGTVHAIGAGCLICEIQQASDLTYRLYDYARRGKDGKLRELHLDDALAVLDYSMRKVPDAQERDIVSAGEYLNDMLPENATCEIFHYRADGEFSVVSPRDHAIFALIYGGRGRISDEERTRPAAVGDTWFHLGKTLKIDGKCKALVIRI